MSVYATPPVGDFGIDGGLDAIASALVADAYRAVLPDDVGAAIDTRAQSTPEREDENVEPGHLVDPLDPRKGHRPNANEPLPVEAPPVPKLRPLE